MAQSTGNTDYSKQDGTKKGIDRFGRKRGFPFPQMCSRLYEFKRNAKKSIKNVVKKYGFGISVKIFVF